MSNLKVVQLGAEWCVPCKRMKPIAKAVAQKQGVEYEYIDIDSDPEIAQKHSVLSLPTFLLFDGDKVVNNATGMLAPAKFTEFLNI